MKILVISDIHGNLNALDTVLAHAGKFDAAWCLGDLVGYGPDPNECVSRVRDLPNLSCIIGNHDAAALQQIDDETFNPEARTAIQWTRNALSDETISFLDNLPEKAQNGTVTMSHGSPRHPVWEYLLDVRTATSSFDYFSTPYCFVGHTHLPVIYTLNETDQYAQLIIPQAEKVLRLDSRADLESGLGWSTSRPGSTRLLCCIRFQR